jgi:hypothetical protein
MRIKKMPFEKNSFILSENKGERSVSKQEQHSLVEWMEQKNMKYNLTGNILTLPREEDQTIFILRWMTE